MAIDPEQFNEPVADYDFGNINDVRTLIDQMATAGGFTATKLAHARDILRDAMATIPFESNESKAGKSDDIDDGSVSREYSTKSGDPLNWLSFPACLMATGARGFFVEAARRRAFNVIVTTCGTLDHDIARSNSDYYHGSFDLDDIELAEHGLNRLGNVIVPNECYGDILEPIIMPWLDEIETARREKNPDNPWLGFGSVELCWEFGKRISDESSLLHWAAKHSIPIIIPGLTDGSIGAQLFMHRQKSPDFMIDVLADEQICSDLVWTAPSSHSLMVGGGISKHHVIWWNQYRGGLDSAVAITTATEHDGSLSGARLREAVSWGKVRPEAPRVVVEGDASLILPLLGADLFV